MSKCLLCDSRKQDPRCGEFIQKGKVVVHEFCLYLSSALLTNGEDDNGLYGFLEKDIISESKRASKLLCAYCHKPYANIGCCKSKCQRSFHTLCGIENGCENQFVGTFRSYCDKHIHKHLRKLPPVGETCCICYDTMRGTSNEDIRKHIWVDTLEAPCCKNGWFHKQCLQGFARSAGYFFKCPLCNDTKKFKEEMPYRGIFVPDRDAAWELEPNAFSELLERPTKCEVEFCKNRRGRNSSEDPNNPLVYCKICGAVAAHQNCLPRKTSDFICTDCTNVTNRAPSNEDSGRESLQITNQHNDENEEVDVCAISDSDDSDFLETFNRQRTRRPNISESSNNEDSAISLAKSRADAGHSKRGSSSSLDKILYFVTSEDSVDSEDFNVRGAYKAADVIKQENDNVFKVEQATDTDESNNCNKIKRRKRLISVIESSEDSSEECFKLKSKKNFNLVIGSSEEDSDKSQSISKRLTEERRRVPQKEETLSQSTYKTRIRNSNTSQKTSTNLNSLSPNLSRNITTPNSYVDFCTFTNTNIVQEDCENSANISCVANRTRRRKTIDSRRALKNITQSENDDSSSDITSGSTKKMRTVSSSSSTSSSMTYYSDASSTISTSDSTSTSTMSAISTTPQSSIAPTPTRQRRVRSKRSTLYASNALNMSCVANRTRHRKSLN